MGNSNWPKLAWSCVFMLFLTSLVLAILCFCCEVSYKTVITVKEIINFVSNIPTGRPNHTCPRDM